MLLFKSSLLFDKDYLVSRLFGKYYVFYFELFMLWQKLGKQLFILVFYYLLFFQRQRNLVRGFREEWVVLLIIGGVD